MNDLLLTLLIVVGIPLLVASAVGIKFLILFLIEGIKGGGSKGGWRRLLEAYATTSSLTGNIVQRQTMLVGLSWYTRCVSLGIADKGLYISIRRRTVLIPWTEFNMVDHRALHQQFDPLLAVGDPPITTISVPWDVFQMMRGKFPAGLAEA